MKMFSLINILLLLPVYTFAQCNDFDLTRTLRNPSNSRLRGKCKDSKQGRTYHSFTGIPYAEPPIGSRRLQNPEPARPWEGTYDATKARNMCLQDPILQGRSIVGSEDCLFVNVYTPMVSKNSSKLLPVMFWIHGGAFQFGSGIHILLESGSFEYYDPAFFMDEGIVVVTINYRLGALGFLTTEDDVIPANLGLKDQLLALKWVQDNINLFGGNPKDIVIAGESAGAGSVCYHLLSNRPEMEAVTGAIMTSGTCLSPWALTINARKKALEVGKKLGSDGSSGQSSESLLRTFQSLPAETFLRAAGMQYIPIKGDDGSPTAKWLPILTKDFYPKEPMTDAIDQGRFHKVPLLFGFNSEECLSILFLEFLPQIRRKAALWDHDPSQMIANVLNVDDRRKAGEDMRAIYTNTSFSEDIAALIKYCTDDQFTLPIGRHAESAAKYGVPVYMYKVAYRYISHLIPGIEGVGHGEDLFFYWDTSITKILSRIFRNYGLISERMSRLLSNFVKYKKPISEREELFQNLAWPAFEGKHLQYMTIDTDLSVDSDPRNYSTKRIVWDKHSQRPISVY